MSETTELIAQQIMNGNINKRTWGDILYNVKSWGAKGDWNTVTSTGTDDTAAIQATIDYAISVGGKAIFFPHGTYKVTALTNVSSVILFGDNAVFSGINNTITQIGAPVTSGIVYNVKDFGAKGDGVTDDTAAIQTVINIINPIGGHMHLPAGTYKITDEFILFGNKLHISGAGMGVTKIIQYGANKGIFSMMENWLKIDNLIENMTLTADTYKAAACIKMLDTHNTHVTLVNISKFQQGVYFADRCFDCYLHDFVISDVYDSGDAIKIDVKPLGGGIFVYNGVVDCWRNFGTNCLRIISCSGSFFSNLDLRASGNNSIYFNPDPNGVIIYNWFTNVLADGSDGNGWNFNAPATSLITGVFMEQCWAGTCAANGVLFQGAGMIDGVDMKGQICIDNSYDGVYLSSGKNITIQGGSFSGNSAHASGQECGIRVKPGVSNFRVIAARSGQTINRANSQAFGIFVENGASNNYQIIDCDLTTNVSAGLVDQGTGTNKIIRSNLGSVTENGGTFTASGTGAVTVFNIPHGMVYPPTKYTVNAGSANASGSFFVTVDANNIIVTYTTAPISGTNNVVLRWDAKSYTLS